MPDLFTLLSSIILILGGGSGLFAALAYMASRAVRQQRRTAGPASRRTQEPRWLPSRAPATYRALPGRPRTEWEERSAW